MAVAIADIENGVQLNYSLSGLKGAKAGLSASTMMACSNEMFQGIMEQNAQLLTFDYRGTGKSTGPDSLDAYTADAYTEDMHQLFRKVGFEKSSIIGYSHGGYFAVDFALQHPERVSALVLIEPALFFDRAKLKERIRVVLEDKEAGIRLLLQQIAPELSRDKKAHARMVQAISDQYPDAIGLAGEWQARISNELGDDDLRDIQVPTLIITGQRSRVRQYTMRAAKLIPRALTWIIPGATHLVLDERPRETAAVINVFLEQYANGGGGGTTPPKKAAKSTKG
jgi:pimeloyl-ACP methyl ester carboxylesterase